MLLTLVYKDILQDLRTKEALTFVVFLSVLFAVVIALGINSAMINQTTIERVFPCLIWIVFIFSATVVITRNLESEFEHMALEGLLILGISPAVIYLSKVISSSMVMAIGLLISCSALAVLLNVAILPHLVALTAIGVLTVLGYAALSSLAVGIANYTTARNLVVPLVLLPLLFPLFLAATELSTVLFANGTFELTSFWLSLLIALDVVYIVLGLNLYQYVIQE